MKKEQVEDKPVAKLNLIDRLSHQLNLNDRLSHPDVDKPVAKLQRFPTTMLFRQICDGFPRDTVVSCHCFQLNSDGPEISDQDSATDMFHHKSVGKLLLATDFRLKLLLAMDFQLKIVVAIDLLLS
ncbi:hypothetical protein Tco_0042112 [Tanacetum coccineum]